MPNGHFAENSCPPHHRTSVANSAHLSKASSLLKGALLSRTFVPVISAPSRAFHVWDQLNQLSAAVGWAADEARRCSLQCQAATAFYTHTAPLIIKAGKILLLV